MHYIGGDRTQGRSESLRLAVKVAQESGLRVGITFGNGAFMIPAGYELVYAASCRLALRTPAGGLVIYKAAKRRPDQPARAYVRISPGYGLDDL